MSAISGFTVGFVLAAGTVMLWTNLPDSNTLPNHEKLLEPAQAQTAAPLDQLPGTVQEGPAPSPPAELSTSESVGFAAPELTSETTETPALSTSASMPMPDTGDLWASYQQTSNEQEPAGEFPWQDCFKRAAASYDLPEALLLAIASGESNFDPAARSDKQAIGLMQIRWPVTSRHLGVRREGDLYKPCTNVDAGARYLRELADHYDNDWHLAVAAYNYGPGRVSKSDVPQGASWYSHYIFQHLLTVLGQEAGTQQSKPQPTLATASRHLLMSFNQSYRARAFVNYLRGELPQLSLVSAREPLGTHAVYLLYESDDERREALQSIASSGVPIEAATNHSTLSF